ncbi:MAG: four helix bundle protein [Gemmatimonadota bacterium]|nr:four helix bundle protein [Gemmatimonadota bacterium]MDQ8167808.1 four helix bundle protein [Gemmatimonadota bacterium]MDQ8172360.1 four helix bundle protein [Gemmatimonadota bacterium]
MPNHFKYRVYDAARDLSRVVHESIETLDVHRVPGLRGQLLASVASIAANIAEGAGAGSNAKLLSHLNVAMGSSHETRTHLSRAKVEGQLPLPLYFRCDNKAAVVETMLAALIRAILENDARRTNATIKSRRP